MSDSRLIDTRVPDPALQEAGRKESASGAAGRLVAACDRHPVRALALLMAAAWLPHVGSGLVSWHFFRAAGAIVLDGRLLDAYAQRPDLQFGPLSYLAAAPLSLLPGPASGIAAMLCMAGLGVASFALLHAAYPPPTARARAVWWLAAAAAACAWGEVAFRYGHLDDALALAFAAGGIYALRRGHPLGAAVLLALSVDAKPWSAPLAVLLWSAESRHRWPALALWAEVVVVAWLPFAAAGLRSIGAAAFAIPVEHASTLSLLGLGYTATPWWCRPAQILLGALLAFAAVKMRSIPAAVLAVFAVRLALDPSVKAYYDVELLMASLICDVTLVKGPLPWLTIIAAATVYAPTYLLTGADAAHAWVRTVGLLAVTMGAFALAWMRRREARSHLSFASS